MHVDCTYNYIQRTRNWFNCRNASIKVKTVTNAVLIENNVSVCVMSTGTQHMTKAFGCYRKGSRWGPRRANRSVTSLTSSGISRWMLSRASPWVDRLTYWSANRKYVLRRFSDENDRSLPAVDEGRCAPAVSWPLGGRDMQQQPVD